MSSSSTQTLMQSLLAGSEPDNTPLTYFGPPIGYSALILEHVTPLGFPTTTVSGNINANRPRFMSNCEDSSCFICAPPSPSIKTKRSKPQLTIKVPVITSSSVKIDSNTFYNVEDLNTCYDAQDLNTSYDVKDMEDTEGTQICNDPDCEECL